MVTTGLVIVHVYFCSSVLLTRSECSRAGSLETLDVQPKANGKNTRDELIKFYEAKYSANLMRLVVYGKGASKLTSVSLFSPY
jgi:hypothetical protein